MNRKKIAFYIESMVVGGAEKVLIDYVNNLNPNLYEVTVIALFKKSVYNDYVFQFEEGFNPNVNYRYLINNENTIWYRIFNFLYSKLNHRLFYRWLVGEKFDIEIAFYEGWPTEFVSCSDNNSVKIAWLHTQQERLYAHVSRERKAELHIIYKQFDKIISVSDAVGQSFSSLFADMFTVTIYNPFNLDLIREKANQSVDYNPEEGVVNFLTVGRFIEVKGYQRLIKAMSICRDEGFVFTLTMIGDGELLNKLQELVIEFHLEEQIAILGHRSNPYPYMKKANCLICSSYAEGFGNVIVESLAVRTPVISTDCGGPFEIVNKSAGGIVCENTDLDLLEKIRSVLRNPGIFMDIKKNMNSMDDLFSVSNAICELEKVFYSKITIDNVDNSFYTNI